jgi:glutamine cyclotransferase
MKMNWNKHGRPTCGHIPISCLYLGLLIVWGLLLVGGAALATAPSPNSASSAPRHSAVVIRTIRHDPSAFTQGLAFADGRLYESTGRYGQSTIRRLDPESGRILQRHDLPAKYFAEGLAILGDQIFQLTWKAGTGFIYRLDALTPSSSFRYAGEGWGLTTDGRYLIMSDGSSRLQFLNPDTFEIQRRLEVFDGGRPVVYLNELEYIEGEIWANVWQTDYIARIDPRSGKVIAWIDLAPLKAYFSPLRRLDVANGIAYDPATKRLVVTGKLWPLLFQIKYPPSLP